MTTPRYAVRLIEDDYVLEPIIQRSTAKQLFWTAGGLGLLYYSLKRTGLLGPAVGAFGAIIAWRSFTGRPALPQRATAAQREMPEQLGPSYQRDKQDLEQRFEQRAVDQVEEASMESFPASDAPALRPSEGNQ